MARRTDKMATTVIMGRSAKHTLRHTVPAFTPGPENRKENKPLDQGFRNEQKVMDHLCKQGVDTWRNPGARLQRLTAKGLVPDLGVRLPALERLVAPQTPQVSGRPQYNALGSVKSQSTSGSAEGKIPGEIMDMALASDLTGVPAFVIIDSVVYTNGQLESWKALGEQQQVVVMTTEELHPGALEAALVSMARRRRSLQTRATSTGNLRPRRGNYRYTQAEDAYLRRRRMHMRATAAVENFG